MSLCFSSACPLVGSLWMPNSRSKVIMDRLSRFPKLQYIYYQMGNSIVEWPVAVGGFYNRCQRLRLPCKVGMNFILHLNLCYFIKMMKQLLSVAVDAKTKFLNECFYYILIQLLLIISGDVEINPGPSDTPHCFTPFQYS